ncbi:MAG: hypothetical protein QM726_15830 [Chitinophagaceae bacterium]
MDVNAGVSTRVFKIQDDEKTKFKIYDFSDRIMLEVSTNISMLFSINKPYIIFSANKRIGKNIYIEKSEEKVLVCVDLIQDEVDSLNLKNNEAIFVCGNAIQILLDKTRTLVPEIKLLKQIKSIIELHFPGKEETFDPSIIPENLKDLIPLIKEWAIPDDQDRSDKVEKTSKVKLLKLFNIIEPKLDIIDAYLDSFEDKPMTHEAMLIGNLGELGAELRLVTAYKTDAK